MKKYADVRISITIEFEDDQRTSLLDQVMDTARDLVNTDAMVDIEIVGPVRDTELPPQHRRGERS